MASCGWSWTWPEARKKILVLAVDGSFCNRTCFRAPRDRTELIARARKDAVICGRAAAGSRRFLRHREIHSGQGVRQNAAQPWKQTKVFYGAKWRKVRYKEVAVVYWQVVAGRCLCVYWWCTDSLSQTQKPQAVLPKAGLLADHDLQDSVSSYSRSISTVGRSK